ADRVAHGRPVDDDRRDRPVVLYENIGHSSHLGLPSVDGTVRNSRSVPQPEPLAALDSAVAAGEHAAPIAPRVDRCADEDTSLRLLPARMTVSIEILDRGAGLGPTLLGASRERDGRHSGNHHVATVAHCRSSAAHRTHDLYLLSG